ncbi:MAG: hypothetical protein AB9869_26365 [Verrucomicrobiia bacterium]
MSSATVMNVGPETFNVIHGKANIGNTQPDNLDPCLASRMLLRHCWLKWRVDSAWGASSQRSARQVMAPYLPTPRTR